MSPYIFTVNILFLIVDTLRVQKKHNFVGMWGGGGGGGVGGVGGVGGGVHGGPLWPTAYRRVQYTRDQRESSTQMRLNRISG